MKTVARWVSRAMWGLLLVIVAFVAIGAYVLPATTSVTSNADDLPSMWRHLDVPTTTTRPATSTTRPAPTTTTTVRPATDGADVFLVIDGERIWRIPRTAMTTKWLWLATGLEQ